TRRDEKDRNEHAVAHRFELLTKLGMSQGLVAVEEFDDRAGKKGAQDRLEAEALGQYDEEGKQGERGPDANLRRRVLQTHECRRDTHGVLGAEYDDGDHEHEQPE